MLDRQALAFAGALTREFGLDGVAVSDQNEFQLGLVR
jgi:hypothetical protein